MNIATIEEAGRFFLMGVKRKYLAEQRVTEAELRATVAELRATVAELREMHWRLGIVRNDLRE